MSADLHPRAHHEPPAASHGEPQPTQASEGPHNCPDPEAQKPPSAPKKTPVWVSILVGFLTIAVIILAASFPYQR